VDVRLIYQSIAAHRVLYNALIESSLSHIMSLRYFFSTFAECLTGVDPFQIRRSKPMALGLSEPKMRFTIQPDGLGAVIV
jgi:hypothetical protein